MSATKFWVSITSAPLGRLAEFARQIEEAGADGIHVDVADGQFVPDLTFGHRVISALTSAVRIPVEAHLMVCTPEEQLRVAADAGAARVAFHLEATRYPARLVSLAQSLGVDAGLAVNPSTPLSALDYLSDGLTFVNVLTTEPDHAGERMLPRMTRRVALAHTIFGDDTVLQVDGDVGAGNVAQLARAGARNFVVGRALIGQNDPAGTLAALRAAVDSTVIAG